MQKHLVIVIFISVYLFALGEGQGCDFVCATDWNPVCSDKHITYSNLCGLQSDACVHNEEVSVLAEGECACDFACTGQHVPVCATDGNTYSNDCYMMFHSCENYGTRLRVASQGECSGSLGASAGSRQPIQGLLTVLASVTLGILAANAGFQC